MAHQDVRATQQEEMQQVVLQHEGVINQLPYSLCRGRGLHLKEIVQGPGGGHVMSRGANPTDAGGDAWHLLCRAPHTEPLKALELHRGKVSLRDIPLLVQHDVDAAAALQAGHGVNGDGLHASLLLPLPRRGSSRSRVRPKRLQVPRGSVRDSE